MKRLNNCLEGKKYNGFPIWFMRQAGRYLPEFREIRKKNPNFINLCLNEKLSSEINNSENDIENIREKIRTCEREINLVSLKNAEAKAKLAGYPLQSVPLPEKF